MKELVQAYNVFLHFLRKMFFYSLYKVWPLYIGSNVKIKVQGEVNIGSGVRISDGAKLHVEKNASLTIGDNVYIGDSTFIKCYSGGIVIGNDVSINAFSFLNGAGGISIGNATRIGAHSILISSNHIFSDKEKLVKDQGTTAKGIFLGENIWLGARVTVLDDVNIVNNTVVGASSLVCKSIDVAGVYVGIPAKILKVNNL